MAGKPHVFILLLPGRELAEDEVEALHEAGCGDAGIETGPHGSLLDFTRVAETREAAIASALADVRKVPGLDPVLEERGYR